MPHPSSTKKQKQASEDEVASSNRINGLSRRTTDNHRGMVLWIVEPSGLPTLVKIVACLLIISSPSTRLVGKRKSMGGPRVFYQHAMIDPLPCIRVATCEVKGRVMR